MLEELQKGPGVVAESMLGTCANLLVVRHAFLLKCRFYDFSGMERPTDQETIAPEKIISYTHRSQEERVHKGAPGSVKSRGREGEEPLQLFL